MSDKPRRPTPRQRKLMTLLLEVEQGKLTIEEAMKQAGYAESTARQQSVTMQQIRQNSVMQDALRKAGFTEELISKKIMEGLEAERTFMVGTGLNATLETAPDMDVQHKYLKTGAELLDAFPAKKNLTANVDPKDLFAQVEDATDYPDSFQA